MAAPSTGRGVLFNTTVNGTTAQQNVSSVMTANQMEMASFQIRSDGGAAISYDIQCTNMGDAYVDGWLANGLPKRDDSYASTDWVTAYTGTVASGTPISIMQVVPYNVHAAWRVRITQTSGSGNVMVVAREQGWGS